MSFLDEFKTEPEAPQQQQQSSGNGWDGNPQPQQQQSNNNSWGSKPSGNSGGGGGREAALQEYIRMQKTVQDPYLPLVVFIDKDFPQDVKDKLVDLIGILVSKGYTVRFNSEDFDIMDKVIQTNGTKVEAHLPFSPFKQLGTNEERKSKHRNNSATTDHIAQSVFGGAWDKLPNFVKIIMSRNARMLIGSKNDSHVKALITWSKDGASKGFEVSNDTGRVGSYIQMAAKLNVPVYNVNSEKSREALNEEILNRGK